MNTETLKSAIENGAIVNIPHPHDSGKRMLTLTVSFTAFAIADAYEFRSMESSAEIAKTLRYKAEIDILQLIRNGVCNNSPSDRMDKNRWLMTMAWLCAARSTCIKGRCGCVLADSHGRVISTGYNGMPYTNTPKHCNDIDKTEYHPCKDGDLGCLAVHAEVNAINNADSCVLLNVEQLFVTTEPCIDCAKIIAERLPALKKVYYVKAHSNPRKAMLGTIHLATEFGSRGRVLQITRIPDISDPWESELLAPHAG